MLIVDWNPASVDDVAYVALLNRSFDGAWTEDSYRWYFKRPFASQAPDRLVISEDGEPVAGCAVNYRRIQVRAGALMQVGVIAGAWTVPEARGAGHFTRAMVESASMAAERGAELLLGFVTADNHGSRGMETAGAKLVPSAYLSASPDRPARGSHARVEIVKRSSADLYDLFRQCARPGSFHYPSAEAWAEQFLHRPHPVDVLRTHTGTVALIERAPDTDRLQWLSGTAVERPPAVAALAARAVAAGRNFFMYGVGEDILGLAARTGLAINPGFVTCVPTGPPSRLRDAQLDGRWDIHSGDRM